MSWHIISPAPVPKSHVVAAARVRNPRLLALSDDPLSHGEWRKYGYHVIAESRPALGSTKVSDKLKLR
jgi:hypothetical protein